MSRKIDEQEKKILLELIIDPRLSDNKISRITGIPVKTVNRKRKKLEDDGLLNYHISVNNGADGTGTFGVMDQFIVLFRQGITRKGFFENFERVGGFTPHDIRHINSAYIGECSGHLALFLLMESGSRQEMLEIFNATIVPKLHAMLGHDCIYRTEVMGLHSNLLTMHNYLPQKNMNKGNIKKDWPRENIFVS